MPEVFRSALIPAPADTVWRTVRDFDGLPTWHPAIASSVLEGDLVTGQVGAVRRLGLGDGAVVREALVRLDDTDRSYTYDILESPFPVVGYRSRIAVFPVTATGESFVGWSLRFDCDLEVADEWSSFFGEQVFDAGLRGLTDHLSSGA